MKACLSLHLSKCHIVGNLMPGSNLFMFGSRGGNRGSRNIVFLSNTGLDDLKNHKATKPAFNIGPSLASQQNTIKMVFRW